MNPSSSPSSDRSSRNSSRRRSGGGRRPQNSSSSERGSSRDNTSNPGPKPQPNLLQRFLALFSGGARKATANGSSPKNTGTTPDRPGSRPAAAPRTPNNRPEATPRPTVDGEAAPRTPARKPEAVEVSTPRLYVGNLSFDATESDLTELFNGVGRAVNAEIISHRHNQRSKGFAFVQMQSVEEAKRAVEQLHDQEFMGRKLFVSGAKNADQHDGPSEPRFAS